MEKIKNMLEIYIYKRIVDVCLCVCVSVCPIDFNTPRSGGSLHQTSYVAPT